MIYTHIAFAPPGCEENIGCAYNKFMELLPNDDDWACFLDHDAIFTTPSWYKQLNDIIGKHPKVGVFGCRTNRIARTFHLVANIDVYNHDMKYHRAIGKHLQQKWYDDVFALEAGKTRQGGFSGVLMLIRKSIWRQLGGFKNTGFLGVDDDVRYKAHDLNIPICIMNGVYVQHWYRANDTEFLGDAKNLFEKIMQKWFNKNQKDNFDLDKIFLFDGTEEGVDLPLGNEDLDAK